MKATAWSCRLRVTSSIIARQISLQCNMLWSALFFKISKIINNAQFVDVFKHKGKFSFCSGGFDLLSLLLCFNNHILMIDSGLIR